MSTGMGTFAEIQEAVETIYKTGNYQLAMMKCSSAYPAASPAIPKVYMLFDKANRDFHPPMFPFQYENTNYHNQWSLYPACMSVFLHSLRQPLSPQRLRAVLLFKCGKFPQTARSLDGKCGAVCAGGAHGAGY